MLVARDASGEGLAVARVAAVAFWRAAREAQISLPLRRRCVSHLYGMHLGSADERPHPVTGSGRPPASFGSPDCR